MITSTIDGISQTKRILVDPDNDDYGWVYTTRTKLTEDKIEVPDPTYHRIRIECEHWAPAGSTTCRFGCTND